MKRLLFSIIALLLACCMLWGCAPKNDIPDSTEPPEPASTDAAQPTEAAGTDVPGTEAPEAVTAGMAYEGVSNYCRYVYGWGTGREGTENCSLMMGEEKDNKRHSVDVRVVHKGDDVILRIKDDCVPFDPGERQQLAEGEDITKNIGIRMVFRIASEVKYQNILGMNVLTIRI